MKTQTSFRCDALESFIARHERDVIGHLHGYDRLRLQGTLPPLYNAEIMHQYLWQTQVLHKDFKAYTEGITRRMRDDLEAAALRRERPVIYLSVRGGKEERARQLAAAQGITERVIFVFSAQETGRTYAAWPNRQTRKLELRLRERRCVHLYVYLLHPDVHPFSDVVSLASIIWPVAVGSDKACGLQRTPRTLNTPPYP